MKAIRFTLFAAFLLSLPSLSVAQQIQVDRQNRTIYVSVTQTVRADAETAVVNVGYFNFGRTQDQTFKESAESANRITQALLGDGIPKQELATESSSLAAIDSPPSDWTFDQKKERQFRARQSWKVRVAVADAQSVVHTAVAGANEVQDVE
jgi:uncharacterized protein